MKTTLLEGTRIDTVHNFEVGGAKVVVPNKLTPSEATLTTLVGSSRHQIESSSSRRRSCRRSSRAGLGIVLRKNRYGSHHWSRHGYHLDELSRDSLLGA